MFGGIRIIAGEIHLVCVYGGMISAFELNAGSLSVSMDDKKPGSRFRIYWKM
jgi:hypothetical protein